MNEPMKEFTWMPWFVFAVAVLVRLFHLGTHSLWVDEIGQVVTAGADWPTLFRGIGTHLSPPLDYMALKPFVGLGHADWWVRFPAFLYGCLAVWLIYDLCRKALNEPVAILAALFLALSPMAVAYAQEVRMYSLFLCLALLSYRLAWEYTVTPSYKTAVLLGLVNGLVLLTHYFGFFLVGTEGVILFLAALRQPARKGRMPGVWLATGLAFVMFLPWVPHFVGQIKNCGGEIYYAMRANQDYFKYTFNAFSIHTGGEEGFWYYLYIALFTAGVVYAIRRRNGFVLALAGSFGFLVLGLFAGSFYKKIVTTRNLIFLLPVYLITVAYGLHGLLSHLRTAYRNIVGYVLTAGLLLLPVLHYHFSGRPDFKPDWKGAAGYVEKKMSADDKIFVFGPISRGCVAYYLEYNAPYVFMRPRMDDRTNRSEDRIWVVDKTVADALNARTLSGYLVLPPNPAGDRYDQDLVESVVSRLGEPVQTFATQGKGRPLKIFRVKGNP